MRPFASLVSDALRFRHPIPSAGAMHFRRPVAAPRAPDMDAGSRGGRP